MATRSGTVPFRFIGGDLALDFVNTVDWTVPEPSNDRLESFGRLLEWAREATLLTSAHVGRLRRLAENRPREATAAVTEARRVRGSLQRVFTAVIDLRRDGPALEEFNRILVETVRHLRVTRSGAGRAWSWSLGTTGEDFRAPLRAVVWAAANLLAGAELGRLRRCGDDDCGWLFLDRSRNGLRRWCQMKTCGTREKSRRRRVGVSGGG